MTAPLCTLAIPTTCRTERVHGLRRAIASVLSQDYPNIELIVSLNGNSYDRRECQRLQSHAQIRLVTEPTASLPLGILRARQASRGFAIGFLDDDDELLPHSVTVRMAALRSDALVVAAFTNGVRVGGPKDDVVVDDRLDQKDLLNSLLTRNWNASCATLYRASVFTESFFADSCPYREWTYFGAKATLAGPIRYIPIHGYRIHRQVGSLSTTHEYRNYGIDALNRLQRLPIPSHVRRHLRRKIAAEFHYIAGRELRRGHRARALAAWLRALAVTPYALRYVPAWRHLFTRSVSSLRKVHPSPKT